MAYEISEIFVNKGGAKLPLTYSPKKGQNDNFDNETPKICKNVHIIQLIIWSNQWVKKGGGGI